MKRLLMLGLFLLTLQWSFSQESYPKKIELGGDIVVAIDTVQLSKINGVIVERNYLKQEIKLLYLHDSTKDSLVNKQLERISNLKQMNEVYSKDLENRNQMIEQLNLQFVDQKKKDKKKNWIIGTLSVAAGVLGGILISR